MILLCSCGGCPLVALLSLLLVVTCHVIVVGHFWLTGSVGVAVV